MKIVADILIDSEESKTGGDFEDIQSDILDVLQNGTANGTLDLVLDDNVTLTATAMSVDKVAFKCPNNTFPAYQTSSCGKISFKILIEYLKKKGNSWLLSLTAVMGLMVLRYLFLTLPVQ